MAISHLIEAALRLCIIAVDLFAQWHRTPTTQETDGFQVKRPGDVGVRCTVLLMLDYQVNQMLWMGCECIRYISISGFLSAEKPANTMMHQKPEQ